MLNINKMSQKQKDEEEEDKIKEDFCPPCLAVPAALALAGGSVAASSTAVDREKHRKLKKTMFIVGIVVAFLSICYSGYVIYKKGSARLAVCSR